MQSQDNIAILGGITIKVVNSEDMFLPLKFEVNGVDQMHIFKNLVADPQGCVTFMYLKE